MTIREDLKYAFARPSGSVRDVSGVTMINDPQPGMTLRQWYKGMALTMMLSMPVEQAVAEAAKIADALLAEDDAHGGG